MNVYSLSHQTQRIGQPVSRTNVQGRPACVDSPWIERKISVTRSTREILGFRLVIVDLSASSCGPWLQNHIPRSLPLPALKTMAATRGLISHQTSAAEIEHGRRFAGIIVIGLACWLTGNWEDS